MLETQFEELPMEYDFDPRTANVYLQHSARLRSQAFTSMFRRIGHGVRQAARSVITLFV